MGRKGVAKATFETKHRDGEITSPAGTKVLGVDIFGPATRDPKRLVAFYQDVLGLTPTDIDENGSGAELADGTTFGVWQPPEAPTSGAGYVALFAVKDINAAVALFRSRGAKLDDPFETPVCILSFGKTPMETNLASTNGSRRA